MIRFMVVKSSQRHILDWVTFFALPGHPWIFLAISTIAFTYTIIGHNLWHFPLYWLRP